MDVRRNDKLRGPLDDDSKVSIVNGHTAFHEVGTDKVPAVSLGNGSRGPK